MKNMIAFLLGLAMLFPLVLLHSDFELAGYQKVVLASSEILSDEYVQCGNDYFCTFYDDEWKKYQNESSAVVFYFDDFNISEFFRNCDEFYECKNIEEIKIYQGYYKGSLNFVNVDGKKVNFQLASNPSGVILGFPMIVVGF